MKKSTISLLEIAKHDLSELCVEVYYNMSEGLGGEEKIDHFDDLTRLLRKIDNCSKFSEVISLIEEGRFQNIGLCGDLENEDGVMDIVEKLEDWLAERARIINES